MARWRRLWHLPSLCVGGVRGRRARRPSELQAKSPRSRQSQLSACCQCARTAPPAPSGTSRRRVGRATRAIFRPASPSQWDLAKLPLGGADAPTRSPSGSFASPSGSFASPSGSPGSPSGSCKARLEKRVGAARRPSPGPTRTSHWEARHYRARATSSGVPSYYTRYRLAEMAFYWEKNLQELRKSRCYTQVQTCLD